MSDPGVAKSSSTDAHVPDYTATGFGGSTSNRLTEAHAQLPDMKALALQACVGATYNPTSNQICFSIPIYGDLCVTSPVSIPVGGALKACAQTCGAIIPTGLKVTIYLNNSPVYSGTVVGSC